MGRLFIVGTPIGNLEDITHRALRILREVNVIACEDTRETRKLLHHFDLHTPTVSYHEHNKLTAGPILVRRLEAGEDVALVTDAGMPAISDPGEDLVRLAIAAGITVVPVPGPTAFVTALVASGLSTARFAFEGFLPIRNKERRAVLERLKGERRTFILYEAPHRLVETLTDLREALGDRKMTAARELTKLHEEYLHGTADELLQHFADHPRPGEFVLVVEGAPAEGGAIDPASLAPSALAEAVSTLEEGGIDRKTAMKEVAVRFGLSKRDVYQALLALKREE